MGRAQAIALAEHGAHVAVHYHSSSGPAEEVVRQVESLGRQAIAVQGDLSDASAAPAIVERTLEAFGKADILVNSAAIFEPGEWYSTTEENWDRHFAINLKSPFFLTQAFAKQVDTEHRAHVINIADWRAVHPGTDHFAYTVAKAGLVAMTKSLALALAPNIQVNAIAPGLILPPPGPRGEAYFSRAAPDIPAQRTGSPAEITKALLFLLESDFVTGELLYVTGGEHLLSGRQP